MGRSDGSIRIVSPYSRPTVAFVSSLSLKHDTSIEVAWIYKPRSQGPGIAIVARGHEENNPQARQLSHWLSNQTVPGQLLQ
jgi:hypothetical protein